MNIFADFFLLHIIGDKGKRKEITDLTMVSPLPPRSSSLPRSSSPPRSFTHQFAQSNRSSFSDEMKIDNIGRPSSPTNLPPQAYSNTIEASDSERSLTYEEFNYTVNLLNNKIDNIYRLCRFLGDQTQEQTKLMKKLVAADELSEQFWKVLIFDYFQSQKSICKIY